MPRISYMFFGVSVLYALIGMLLGMHMGESMDFTLAPAHAHWNLLGWVGNSIYGIFFALSGANSPKKLAAVVFAVHNVGVPVMIIFLGAFLLNPQNLMLIPGIVVGEVLVVLGMFCYAISVWVAMTNAKKNEPAG